MERGIFAKICEIGASQNWKHCGSTKRCRLKKCSKCMGICLPLGSVGCPDEMPQSVSVEMQNNKQVLSCVIYSQCGPRRRALTIALHFDVMKKLQPVCRLAPFLIVDLRSFIEVMRSY